MKFLKINNLKEYSIFFWLILTTLISIIILSVYNTTLDDQNKKIKSTLENIYLKKTLKEITKNLKPRYTKIEYISKAGDTHQNIIDQLNTTKRKKNYWIQY